MTTGARLPVRHVPDGTTVIGSTSPAPAGSAILPLDGVTVVFDPTMPVSRAVVHDPRRGAATVAALFGDAISRAVESGVDAEVEPLDTDERRQVERLGWLAWLSQHRPVPLDPELLQFETAITCADLPLRPPADHQEDGEHDRWALDFSTVVAVARALREDSSIPLRGPLMSFTRLALAHLPVGNDVAYPEVAHERAMWRVMDAWGAAELDARDLAWLDPALTLTPAAHLGAAASSSASLDWRRLPSQLLPAPEASVTFELAELPDRSGVLTIAVAGPPLPRLHPALPRRSSRPPAVVASLTAERWPLPLTTGPLAYDAAGHVWRGRFPLSSPTLTLARQAPSLDVDVRAAHLPFTPPDPSARHRALARRWAARAMSFLRLATVAEDGQRQHAARDVLRFAARLWAQAGDRPAAERCVAVATEPLLRPELTLAERWLLESGTL